MTIRISKPVNWAEREKELREQIEKWLKDSKQPRLKEIVDTIIDFEKKMEGE